MISMYHWYMFPQNKSKKKVSDLVMKDWISKMDIDSSMSANEVLNIEQTHSFGTCECSELFICIA